MRYVSTRGKADPVSFADAMITGLAPDGGLYVPAELPRISDDEWRAWAPLPYAAMAAELLSRFAPDFDRATIDEACAAAYSPEVFAAPGVAPLRRLVDDTWLLNLSSGPTLAFKDMALQLLGRLFDAELARRSA